MLLLALTMLYGLGACKNKNDDGTVQSGELVVLNDDSEIGLGVYEVDTLNPFETKSESVREAMNIIYEPLFTYDEKRNVSGVLAKDYTISPDGTQITVNLKEGVKWQDGTSFTADDVVYTLSKMRNSGGAYRKTADKIRSFTAVSKAQVVINLERQEPDFSYMLTFPIISKNTAYTMDDGFAPMGTGSYKLTKRTGTEFVLEPNSEWHGGVPSKKRILVKILKNKEAAADAFNVNGLDAVTSEEISVVSGSPKMNSQIKEFVSDKMVFLGFNTQSPSLVSANVRRTVALMLDKERLVNEYAYGYGVPAEIAINPSSWAYYKPEEKEPDEEMLPAEGYALSDGVYYKDGQPLWVRLLVNSDNEQRCRIADSIAESLKSGGFSVQVERVSYQDYISRINAGDFDMFVGEIETAANLNPAELLSGNTNYFGFDAQALKDAAAALFGVTDKETYKSGIKTFTNIFEANPPYVPLYFKKESVIYGSYVSGIAAPTQFNAYKNIEKWYFYDKDGLEKDTED